MKHFFLPLLFILLTAPFANAQNEALSGFVEKYKNEQGFTHAFLSKDLFEVVTRTGIEDKDWKKLHNVVKNIGSLSILAADSVENAWSIYKEVLPLVPADVFDELLTVRDGKENVRIWVKDTENIIEELLLLVGAPDEFVLLSFTGKIDLDKISELSKTLDIDGAQHLEKVKSRKDSKIKIDTEDGKN